MKGKILFLISLLVLAIFVAGCKEQSGEAVKKIYANQPYNPSNPKPNAGIPDPTAPKIGTPTPVHSGPATSATIDSLRYVCSIGGGVPQVTWTWTVTAAGDVGLTNVILNGILQTRHPGMDMDTTIAGNQQEWFLSGTYDSFRCGTNYILGLNVTSTSGGYLASATNLANCPCS